MTVDELIVDIAHQLQDPALAVVNRPQVVNFINDAAHDASNGGWFVKLDDSAGITIVSGTFEYAIPSTFVLIYELRDSGAGDLNVIPYSHWTIEDGVTPVIRFSEELYDTTASGHNGETVVIKGHRRPSLAYVEGTGVIDIGMESFLRERAVAYAARNISKGSSTKAAGYRNLAETAWLRSESLMEAQQDLLRPLPYSRRVYGR